MSKRTYRSKNVQQLSVDTLCQQVAPGPLLIGIDVAKSAMVAALGTTQSGSETLIRFEHPAQSRLFLQQLQEVQQRGIEVQVALEPTGTYGDALSYRLDQQGVQVFRVNPKKTHDYQEVVDGVPSQHDGKDALVILQLHRQRLSRRWQPLEVRRRDLRALVAQRELHAERREALYNQLEAMLAWLWPELESVLELRQRSTGVKLLANYGTPEQVEAQAQEVLEFLRCESRGMLPEPKRNEVVAAATGTLGVPATAGERALVQSQAEQILQAGRQVKEFEQALAEQMKRWPEATGVVRLVGTTTAAILYGDLGDLGSYASAGALEKSCGLNLKEQSSGQYQSRLHLTKRGPSRVRKYLYLAVLRWVQWDEMARAWYERRRSYQHGSKQAAVVALMRKLLRAVWHVAKGASYEPALLFDVIRLKLSSGSEGGAPAQEPREEQEEARTAPTGTAASPKAPVIRRPMRGPQARTTPTGPTATRGAAPREPSDSALRRGEGDKFGTGGAGVTGGRPGGTAGVRDTGGGASGARPGPCAPAPSTAPAGGLSR